MYENLQQKMWKEIVSITIAFDMSIQKHVLALLHKKDKIITNLLSDTKHPHKRVPKFYKAANLCIVVYAFTDICMT
jgi:hypothetical protein